MALLPRNYTGLINMQILWLYMGANSHNSSFSRNKTIGLSLFSGANAEVSGSTFSHNGTGVHVGTNSYVHADTNSAHATNNSTPLSCSNGGKIYGVNGSGFTCYST